jgi:L-fuculose-phosphate aldolase
METVEHFARISLVAELLGGAKALPQVEVDKLLDSRSRYGVQTQVRAEPGCPVSMEDLQRQQGKVQASGGSDKIEVTREELIALVEEAIKARGLA